ncbi:MAG: phosphoribosylformylglycinamidine synthase subunit PurQ [Minwuiales bacterium]|nr:phosphoribosylformylglycinamidine synthase subunit PurQ [Minwuiales bacterium]
MQASVIVFPGSNCDRDVKVALAESVGRDPTMVWHGDSSLPKSDLIVLPGGFAYGDYLRCGAIAAHSPIMRDVVREAERGTPVLAICNGFQVAIESGLLPGALMSNANLKYICKDVHLRVENVHTCFTAGYDEDDVIRIPIAHHDGNYFADDDTIAELEDDDRIVFRYSSPDGAVDAGSNPNGSRGNIAGIVNKSRNVLGMMPHPERLSDPVHGGTDGRAIFDTLAGSLG